MAQTEGPWTVERVLNWTRGYFERRQVDSPRLGAELILAHVLNTQRIKLYTNYQRPLADGELTSIRGLVQRAGEEEPIAYLTGQAHFFNLEFVVTRDVLIPRPDTETLVEQTLALSRHTGGFESPRVLDLCTGSGCVAIAIATNQKNAQVIATDISEAALAVAKQNVEKHNLADRVTLLHGDLFGALAGYVDPAPFDVIVSNPPYIASGQIEGLPKNVRDYEPRLALDGGSDGLGPHRRILDGAADRLRRGGRVFLEIAYDQEEAALGLLQTRDAFENPRVLRDHAGQPRVLTATRKDG
jgi:release factor glutamine methyltransferase